MITSPYDFNHDRQINATDVATAVSNQTSFLNALRLISLPSGGSAARTGSTQGVQGSSGSDSNGTTGKTIAIRQPTPLFAMGLIAPPTLPVPQPRSIIRRNETLANLRLDWPAKLIYESSRLTEVIASIENDKDDVKDDDFEASIDAIMTDLDLSLAL